MEEVQNKFITDVFIAEYDVDMYMNLKISSLLRHMQEVGSLHLESMGFSYDIMAARGYVYLLVNLHVVLYRQIKSHETIQFHTWVPKNSGFRTYRNFKMYDSDGNLACEASTVWVLADVNTHKIVSLDKSPVDLRFNSEEKLGIADAKKIKVPQDMKQTSSRKVRYTDLDVNAHVNNSIYGDIFYDESGVDFSKYWISDFSINYRKEAIYGDIISIHSETKLPNVYLAGIVNDISSFEVLCKVSER